VIDFQFAVFVMVKNINSVFFTLKKKLSVFFLRLYISFTNFVIQVEVTDPTMQRRQRSTSLKKNWF